MYLKKTQFANQDKKLKDLDNANDYPTIADLMREQNLSNDEVNTVHYRREIDYIKRVYKIRVQTEIESYKDLEDEGMRDNNQAQHILILENILI